MKIIRDTLTTDDPNEFGELLREYCFTPKHKTGCYSTFDLLPEFIKKQPPDRILYILLGANYKTNDYLQGMEELIHYYTNGAIEVAWYWDGDGTLYFREADKEAINTDCKKDYEWQWR